MQIEAPLHSLCPHLQISPALAGLWHESLPSAAPGQFPQAMQTAPQTQADLSVLGHGVRAGLQLHKDCSEEYGAGLLSLRVCCICRHPQHLPGDMCVELQVPNVRGRPMLRQRQRCGRKVALLRLLLGVPAAQSVLAVQSWAPYFHYEGGPARTGRYVSVPRACPDRGPCSCLQQNWLSTPCVPESSSCPAEVLRPDQHKSRPFADLTRRPVKARSHNHRSRPHSTSRRTWRVLPAH